MSLSIPDGENYEEMAADILAKIADLLLGEKRDWATLMRISAAINPPSIEEEPKRGPFKGSNPKGVVLDEAFTSNPELDKSIREAMETIYRRKVEDEAIRSMYPVTFTNSTNTANPGMWVHTDYRTKRDGKH